MDSRNHKDIRRVYRRQGEDYERRTGRSRKDLDAVDSENSYRHYRDSDVNGNAPGYFDADDLYEQYGEG